MWAAQFPGSHNQDTLIRCQMTAETFVSPRLIEGEASFLPALDTNPKWTTDASFTLPFIHPDKNTAKKGQQGPADVRLLGYEEI